MNDKNDKTERTCLDIWLESLQKDEESGNNLYEINVELDKMKTPRVRKIQMAGAPTRTSDTDHEVLAVKEKVPDQKKTESKVSHKEDNWEKFETAQFANVPSNASVPRGLSKGRRGEHHVFLSKYKSSN